MTPPPPYLSPRIARFDSAELFYIVKHGIKLTAMPAWPSLERDDEVWAVVGFLQRMPEIDAADYRLLAHGESTSAGSFESPQGSKVVAENCASCHGHDGRGRAGGAFPRLAGQTPQYLEAALDAYATGQRHSGIMELAVTELTAPELRELAQYYAGLPKSLYDSTAEAGSAAPQSDQATAATTAVIQRGEAIAIHGIPEQGVPSCSDCHGPAEHERTPTYPSLLGQHSDYLVLQLELFKEQKRGGSPSAHVMWPVASRLTPKQIRDVAHYYASASPD
jgi:cytochrome c553